MEITVALDGEKKRDLRFFAGDDMSLTIVVYAHDGDITPITVSNVRFAAADGSLPMDAEFVVPSNFFGRVPYRIVGEVDGITTTLAYGVMQTAGGWPSLFCWCSGPGPYGIVGKSDNITVLDAHQNFDGIVSVEGALQQLGDFKKATGDIPGLVDTAVQAASDAEAAAQEAVDTLDSTVKKSDLAATDGATTVGTTEGPLQVALDARPTSDALAAFDGATKLGNTYPEAPAYLKTVSDILNGDDVSIHRWMTSAEINDALADVGSIDSTLSFQDAFSNYSRLKLARGKYRLTAGATMNFDNADVDFGAAQIVCDFALGGTAFTFGTTANTPSRNGLRVRGGRFSQANPATTQNSNYIRVAATQDFEIYGQVLYNVSNGGILIEAGCQDGDIHHVAVEGKSGNATCRGIWLAGSTATDFALQLVDTTSITRNATAAPVYAVKDVRVHHNKVRLSAYGIYLMNTRDCSVEDNLIDISGIGATRCVAVNNYSPGTRISRNTLISDRSATGVLITQCSDSVEVSNNRFKGTFGGGRDIYVQYLSEALIFGNRFNTDGTQNIQVDMGGSPIIKENWFLKDARTADARCVYVTPIDPAAAGTGTVGDTATVLPPVIFKNNIVKRRCIGVLVDTSTYASTSGNKPAIEMINFDNNEMFAMNLAASASEYPLNVNTGTSTNITRFTFDGNKVFPNTAALRNKPLVSGASAYSESTQSKIARFTVSVATAGGAITVAKSAGANYSLTATRSGMDLFLTPRSLAGVSGAEVAPPFGFSDLGGTIYRFASRRSGTSYLLSAFDSAGAQIDFASAAGSFDVVLGAMVAT